MPSLSSTVPGAIAALNVHFQAVADSAEIELGNYVGPPFGTVANNFLIIGDAEGKGELITNYQQGFQGMYQPPLRRTESYGLHCALRVWNAAIDATARLTEAFDVLSAVMTRLAADVEPAALAPSGSWSVTSIENTAAGALGGKGWGCVFGFDVQVQQVILTDL